MAYRNIDIDFWQDEYVLNLDTDEKLFYLYLLTNGKTTQIGVYPLVMKVIKFETGYSEKVINDFMDKLTADGKITRSEDTKEICLINWYKYNYVNKSPKVMNYLWKEWLEIKSFEFKYLVFENMLKTFSHKKLYVEMDKVLSDNPAFMNVLKEKDKKNLTAIATSYNYPIDTLWIGYREQSEEQSQEESEEEEKEQSISQSYSKEDYEYESEYRECDDSYSLKDSEADILEDGWSLEEASWCVDLDCDFERLIDSWNESEMGVKRPVRRVNNAMVGYGKELINNYGVEYILRIMKEIPTNRWYLGEICGASGEVFNISFTWFLNMKHFEELEERFS